LQRNLANQEANDRKLIYRMMKERNGKLSKTHRLLAKIDIEFLSTYDDLFALIMAKDRALSIKTKELIVIGILASKGQYDALNTHVKRALKIGVTRAEAMEVLEVAMLYAGTESMIRGGIELVDALKGGKDKL
jgi:alkylhydroperoxidase/carboxymuconolactone decarboxylase family protein YurZ